MAKPSKTLLVLRRIIDGSWEKTNTSSPGGCVMTTHISALEELMKEKYVRENTSVGAIAPDDMIRRMEVDENGTIRFYIAAIPEGLKQCQT